MPGVGYFPAGSGPAGASPVVSSPRRAPVAKGALRYEGKTRGWVQDGSGQYVKLHPVEQAVALSMCTRKGSLKSAPNVGNTLFEVEYLDTPDIVADIEDRVRNAFPLSQLVAAGDVEIVKIDHDVSNGLLVTLYFKNLRATDPSKELRFPPIV
ncbi:MAG TPA: hypothetical protein VGJ91_11665 [Polyangiaceae bacterium]|jgi:hypothetical protein